MPPFRYFETIIEHTVSANSNYSITLVKLPELIQKMQLTDEKRRIVISFVEMLLQ